MEREFLVTKMICANCGGNLSLTYKLPTAVSRHAQGEPTGAAMVEMLVSVQPCRTCMAPMETLRAAARTLLSAGA